MKEWRYVKPLANENLIHEAEKELGYNFGDSYINFVKLYNGGRPPMSVFNTKLTKKRTIKSFLSFNTSDSENILTLNRISSEYLEGLIAFAIDSFGNYICFSKEDGSVYFYDYETGSKEFISDNFDTFLGIINK